MNATDILTDPIRIASMAIFAPFLIRAAWRRVRLYRNARIVSQRVRAIRSER